MNHVVYLLGAGFSAPLGLPVMRDFLLKSKDMFATDPKEYASFRDIFALIKQMGSIQSYYRADLFNIEEILSILEMDQQVAGKRSKRFAKYIADVVRFYTPPDPTADPPRFPANWHERPMSDNMQWLPYFYFAANLLRIRMRQDLSNANRTFPINPDDSNSTVYSIVTLNYDLIFERLSQYLTRFFPREGRLEFALRSEPVNATDHHLVPLAKLHGSIDADNIIAPTWNKKVARGILEAWKAAHNLLSSANEIRIVGYSLPVADAYIKYLLKSAVVASPHLKQIDIICRDGDGATRSRYRDFISFKYARFTSADIHDYLEFIKEETSLRGRMEDTSLAFNQLEFAHSDFFDRDGGPL
jgi:hypothetical protein